jgi:TM2 domain-containing membrane protein YozV
MQTAQKLDDSREKSVGLAIFLNFLLVGLGNLYVEDTQNGIIFLAVSCVVGFIVFLSGGVFLIVAIPYWIWGMYQVNTVATKYQTHFATLREQEAQNAAEQETADKKRKLLEAKISSDNFLTELKKFKQLQEADIISAEEFGQKKQALIASVQIKGIQGAPEDFLAALILPLQGGSLSQEDVRAIKSAIL